MSKSELIAEMQQDERERRDLRSQRARVSAPGDGLIRKAMGDTLPRSSEMPEGLTLFGDARDEQLVSVLGMVISITRRQLRKEIAEELAERDPQLRKIAELELKAAKLSGAVEVLRGSAPTPTPRFPSVRAWAADTVYHEGDVVAFAGGTYQAKRDTARTPGSQDWVCLAVAGAGFTVRGTYYGGEEYRHLDVVIVNGSSFVALRDRPGPCPGEDWHLLASRGSRGSRGERGLAGLTGARGEPGADAPTIVDWHVDKATYRATPVMSNGKLGAVLDLHGLFEQFLLETQS
jgi:hypothetical protein